MHMFSKETRCHYRRNQLSEVICQLRFPEILAISEKHPWISRRPSGPISPSFSGAWMWPRPRSPVYPAI